MSDKIKFLLVFLLIVVVAVTTVIVINLLAKEEVSDINTEEMLSWILNDKYAVFEKIVQGESETQRVQQINNIRMIEENKNILEVDGELFNHTGEVENYAYRYNTRIEVQDNQVVQKVTKGSPIDGVLNYSILLKWPLIENEQWQFASQTTDGKVLNINAKINQILGDKIVVSYKSDDDSYDEERTYQKGKGLVIIKTKYVVKALPISQKYLLEENSMVETVKTSNRGEIPLHRGNDFTRNWLVTKDTEINGKDILKDYPDLYDWFIGYQTNWINFINEDDEEIYTLIAPNSRVNDIIRTFNKEGIKEQFSKIDIISLTIDDNIYIITTKEKITVYKNGAFFEEEYEQNYEITKGQIDYYLKNLY